MHEFVIETERLILRPLSVEDCDAVYKWVSDDYDSQIINQK